MKQRITQQQWDEINGEMQGIWLEQIGYDSSTSYCAEPWKLIHIGQMIAFLGEQNGMGKLEWFQGLFWHGCCGHACRGHKDDLESSYDTGELCDALWEAVKSKLNEDN